MSKTLLIQSEREMGEITSSIDFLIDGQISSFYPDQHEVKLLTLIMQSHSIFVKLMAMFVLVNSK